MSSAIQSEVLSAGNAGYRLRDGESESVRPVRLTADDVKEIWSNYQIILASSRGPNNKKTAICQSPKEFEHWERYRAAKRIGNDGWEHDWFEDEKRRLAASRKRVAHKKWLGSHKATAWRRFVRYVRDNKIREEKRLAGNNRVRVREPYPLYAALPETILSCVDFLQSLSLSGSWNGLLSSLNISGSWNDWVQNRTVISEQTISEWRRKYWLAVGTPHLNGGHGHIGWENIGRHENSKCHGNVHFQNVAFDTGLGRLRGNSGMHPSEYDDVARYTLLKRQAEWYEAGAESSKARIVLHEGIEYHPHEQTDSWWANDIDARGEPPLRGLGLKNTYPRADHSMTKPCFGKAAFAWQGFQGFVPVIMPLIMVRPNSAA